MLGMPIPPKRLRPDRQWTLDDYPLAASLHPGGRYAAVGLGKGQVTTLDLASGAVLGSFEADPTGLCSLEFSPEAAVLASGGHGGDVGLWTLDGRRVGRGVPETDARYSPWCEHVTWSPDGRFLASSSGKRVYLWTPDGELHRSYSPLGSTVTGLAWWTDDATDSAQDEGAVLAASAYGGVVTHFPLGERPSREYAWKGSVITLAWSPNGRFIATGDQDCTVHFWYVASGRDLQMWGYPSKVASLAWSPDSRWLATGGSPHVMVWDCSGPGPEGRKPVMLKGHADLISALAWQPGGRFLASGSSDGIVRIWAPTRLEWSVGRWEGKGEITTLTWLSDPRRLLVTTGSGEVAILDTKPLERRVPSP